MPYNVISVENLTKQYDLGVIGTGTISRDLNRWWARVRKQPDPYTRIGHEDAFARIGETILALDDVSFTVQQGEALGIIGRNGAGKSTLLKILSRVTAPTSGVVKVKGRIGSLLEVGTGFHPELTGRENVYLNGAILGMKKAEITRRFDEIVSFAGVEKFIDTPVKRYSSGMYVRLAFAVAAHLDPEILIVDEVLAVGDAEFQKKCLGKMGDVAGEGRTVLFVSHNLNSINLLCSKTIVLELGKLMINGDTKSAIDYYLNSKLVKTLNSNIGDDRFTLINTYLPKSETSTEEAISIILACEILKPTPNLRIGFDLFNSQGMVIFRSWHDDFDEEKSTLLPGKYQFKITIPQDLLKPDKYRISIEVGIHNIEMIISDCCFLEFSVVNVGGVNKLYNDNRRPGLINPHIKWEVEN